MDANTTITTRTRAQRFIIKRPRLTKLLDESEARIILLQAPGGYGKTTLAREWLSERSDVAWYPGGPAVADVAALATGVTGSVTHPGGADAIESVKRLAARGQGSEGLAHAVASLVPSNLSTLVIDDYHFGADSPEITAFVTSLLALTPLRFVLASRVRPPWIHPRMVVYGEATIVETSALAFTDEEAEAVLGVPDGTRPRILVQAHGWPAVIGLAATRPEALDLDAALPPADLYDFFAEDLYKRAAPQLRIDLLLLAIGADADARVARELFTSRHDDVIAEAAARGFITRGRGATVSMHPLLRHFLLGKLEEIEANERASYFVRVVKGLARHGHWDECLVALQAFPDADLIVSTLTGALVGLLDSGRLATVERWVELAKTNHINHPTLLLAEAEVALRHGEPVRAQALGERAGDLLGGDLAARAYLVATRAAHLGDNPPSVTSNAARVEAVAASVDLKVEALWLVVANATERPDQPATEALERLRLLRDDRPDHALRLLDAEGLLHLVTEGNALSSARQFELATGLLPHVRDPLLRTNHLNSYAHVLVMLAEYEAGLSRISELLEESRAAGLTFVVDYALLTRAAALTGLRRYVESQRTLDQLEQRLATSSPYVATNANLQAARLRIALGDLGRAAVLLQREPPDPPKAALRNEHLAHRGLVLAARGETDAAEDVLQEAGMRPGYVGATVLAEFGMAIVEIQRGREETSGAASEVVRRNAALGHLDSLVTACRAFPELAVAAARDQRAAQILTETFGKSGDIDLGRKTGLEMPRELRRGQVLSQRERDVYELLSLGLSNSEIAKRLFISQSTAKVHVRHIFEKLGVHTRAEVARARLPDDLFA